ncbi:MAG: hypothetical protein QG656_1980 [Candidatus Hydrogenedentes bacterium]|nr:hypothetical protein [Candidatus Hydrogenedentota bacterium]
METRNPDYREAVARLIEIAPFIRELGMRLTGVGPGWCETALDLGPRHEQQDGYVHAGVIATVADHTAGSAATSVVAPNEYILSAEFKINFLRAARGKRLTCRAKVLKPGRTLVVVESEVYVEDETGTRMTAKALLTMAVLQRGESA